MSSELLVNFKWGSAQNTPMTGTDDWVDVAELDDGRCEYEWSEFKAFYSPSARRYFWHGDGGCSCNSWSDDVHSAADFEDGDKAALLRAWEAFAKDHYINTDIYLAGVITINNFNEKSN